MKNTVNPCDICRGACCETLVTPLSQDDRVNEWLAARGEVCEKFVRLECRCKHLDPDGRCRIYRTRPQLCRDYPVGSPACIEAIRHRRSALMMDVIIRYIEKICSTN